MRAVVVSRPGGPEALRVQTIPIRKPGRGEVRVRVHAAGVNRADLLQRRGLYPAPPGWPSEVPGLEYAGVVESVGEGVELWEENDRVMGLVGGGGYAEFVVVPEREVLAVPPVLDLVQAAGVPEVFITAHDALITQLGLRVGESLLIHAVGSGVGTAALQLAKAAGATVMGASRSEWKLERATDLGLDVLIDASQHDIAKMVEQATGGAGVDALLDLVGGAYLGASLASLSLRGRMIVVGLTAGRTAEIDLGLVLRKRLSITGTSLRSRPLEERIAAARAFERDIGGLLASGQVRPVIDKVFHLEEAPEAHRHMESNANFGKVVLKLRSA
ncbi:MAG: NAD(P)H-quinone oxidoreductase [Gemmatimonadota bacterium]|nr:MAG: NAD(P)H-quinone oxidoreductase [Gemmatimonadota bacterium]